MDLFIIPAIADIISPLYFPPLALLIKQYSTGRAVTAGGAFVVTHFCRYTY